MTQELPIITFNSLYNVLKQEERSPELNSLPQLFYEATDNFIHKKKQESEQYAQDVQLQRKVKTAQTIYFKIKKLRAKKIAEMVIYDSLDEQQLLATENAFRENIKNAFDIYHIEEKQ